MIRVSVTVHTVTTFSGSWIAASLAAP
jgi:hypothetical protein